MQLTSPAFPEGSQIPVRYSRDGENTSPPLKWWGVPEATQEFALILECTTPSTREPHAQWLIYKLPAEMRELPEGFHHKARPETAVELAQGTNDDGNVGYDGPLGTVGQDQQYRFQLYALRSPVAAEPGLTKQQLMRDISRHVIDTAELHAHYQRPRG